ncbi:MAG TPA: oligosaccharide flippase family protein [Tepidisphaeraceae bacterium]|nr:oligosaccharide flippase family protein [Tepidisphaeraceae bacterium]
MTPTALPTPADPADVVVTDPDGSASVELADATPAAVVADDQPTVAPTIDPAVGPLGGNARPGDYVALARLQANDQTLRQKAYRSSLFTLVAFGFGQMVRFGSAPLVAYLLVKPEYLGVVALVGVFTTLLEAVSDVGTEHAIMQHKRGDEPVFLNTAFTLHAVRGVVLWLVACALAYPIYLLYRGQAEADYLLWMLPVLGISLLIRGFNSTSTSTLNRHLMVGRLTALSLAHLLVSTGVTIAIAWVWRTPWSMVLGGLAANVMYMVASHLLLRGYRNRFCWDAGARRELMHFGKWILVSTLTTYLAYNIDRPLLGKLTDLRWLGLYGIAMTLVFIPREIIGRLMMVTLFPALSRTAESRRQDLPAVVRKARGVTLTASLVLTLGVVLAGPLFITIFYKPEFHVAGWLTQLAAIGAWFILLTATADRALLAVGKSRALAASNVVNLVVSVVGCLVGLYVEERVFGHADGVAGFMLGLAVGKLAGHAMIQIEMAREGMSIFRQDVLYTALLLALSLAGIWAPRWVTHWWRPGHDFQNQLFAAIAVCAAVGAWAALRVRKAIR